MARRKKTTEVKGDMTPMIDMVFQLLIFFILTLNIVDPEGDFYLRLPKPGAAQASESDIVPDVMRIVLISNTNGDLTGLTVDNVQSRMRTSTDPDEDDLRKRIRSKMGNASGKPEDFEIELGWGGPGATSLKYRYVLKVIGICTGERQPDGTVKPLVQKIKLLQ